MYLGRFMREFPHTRIFRSGVIIFIFFRPAISLLGPDETLIFSPHASIGPWGVHGQRSPFSFRASRGQIVALMMGRLEGHHCCSGACAKFNLKALYAVCHLHLLCAALPERDGLLGLSVLCVSTVSVCGDDEAISTVWPLVSYLFRRSLCSFCEIKALYAAARFAVESADRLLAVLFLQCGILPCHLLRTQR